MADEQDSRPAAESARKRGRQLALVALFALLGAVVVAVAAGLTWWSADYADPLTGALSITASGADCVPELIPLALVALAGFGAALATRGLPRRLIGVVLMLSGVTLLVRSALTFGSAPAVLVTGLTRPADPVGSAQLHPAGPLLAVVGAVLIGVAGVLITLGIGGRQRLGTRYDAPGRVKSGEPAGGTTTDGDPADWWKALDAGDDPTADSPVQGTSPAVSDRTSGDGYDGPNTARLT
jgi:uncharacterized membrane protein (TIGR02234 family)